MTLTANRDVDHYIDQELRSYLVAPGTHIYKGALVGLSSDDGDARPLVPGDLFIGIAHKEIDNTGCDGWYGVQVYTLGDFGFQLPGATMADIGRPVYASSDERVTFTEADSADAGNSYVGRVVGVGKPGEIILRLDTLKRTVVFS